MAEVKQIYPIQGMHCASCLRVIEKSLTKIPGVKDASVNLVTEKATVLYDDIQCGPAEIASAVSNVGYKALVQQEKIDETEEKKGRRKTTQDIRK